MGENTQELLSVQSKRVSLYNLHHLQKITSKTQPGKNIFHKLILSLHRAPLKVELSRISLQKPCPPHNSFHFNPDITKYVRYVETGPPHLFNHKIIPDGETIFWRWVTFRSIECRNYLKSDNTRPHFPRCRDQHRSAFTPSSSWRMNIFLGFFGQILNMQPSTNPQILPEFKVCYKCYIWIGSK